MKLRAISFKSKIKKHVLDIIMNWMMRNGPIAQMKDEKLNNLNSIINKYFSIQALNSNKVDSCILG